MRRSERLPIDEKTRLRPNHWSSLEVRVVDISETGFRADCEARILCGTAVWIDLPGIGEVEAQVSWRRHGQIGGRFIVPIDLSRCTAARPSEEAVLARLLVDRAAARTSGRFAEEIELRHKISRALPLRRLHG